MKCCVLSCKSYSDRRFEDLNNITFHVFPCEENLKLQWIRKINRQDWTPTKYTKICSCHFNDEDYIVTKKGLRKLKKGTLPSIKLDNSSLKRTLPEPTLSSSKPNELNEFLIFHDCTKKLKQDVAHLRWKAQRDRLKIRGLQMKVLRLKKKIEESPGPSKKSRLSEAEPEIEIEAQSYPATDDEECELFGKMLTCELKNVDRKNRLIIMNKIDSYMQRRLMNMMANREGPSSPCPSISLTDDENDDEPVSIKTEPDPLYVSPINQEH